MLASSTISPKAGRSYGHSLRSVGSDMSSSACRISLRFDANSAGRIRIMRVFPSSLGFPPSCFRIGLGLDRALARSTMLQKLRFLHWEISPQTDQRSPPASSDQKKPQEEPEGSRGAEKITLAQRLPPIGSSETQIDLFRKPAPKDPSTVPANSEPD